MQPALLGNEKSKGHPEKKKNTRTLHSSKTIISARNTVGCREKHRREIKAAMCRQGGEGTRPRGKKDAPSGGQLERQKWKPSRRLLNKDEERAAMSRE